MSDTITVQAACHCGAFAVEFPHAPFSGPNIKQEDRALRCDCSICASRVYVFIYTYLEELQFHKGSLDKLTLYQYGEKTIEHFFCGTCGSGLMHIDKSNAPGGTVGVNLRYARDVDVDGLDVRLCYNKDGGTCPGPAGRWDVFEAGSKGKGVKE